MVPLPFWKSRGEGVPEQVEGKSSGHASNQKNESKKVGAGPLLRILPGTDRRATEEFKDHFQDVLGDVSPQKDPDKLK